MSLKQKFNPLIKKRFNQVDKELASDGNFIPRIGTVVDNLEDAIPIVSAIVTDIGGAITRVTVTFSEDHDYTTQDTFVLTGAIQSEYNLRYHITSAPTSTVIIGEVHDLYRTNNGNFLGTLTGAIIVRKAPLYCGGGGGSSTITILSGVATITNVAEVITITNGDTIQISSHPSIGSGSDEDIFTNLAGTVTDFTAGTLTISTTSLDKTTTESSFLVRFTQTFPDALPVLGNINYQFDPRDLPDYGDRSVITKETMDDADLVHSGNTNNPHLVNKADVGLSNVIDEEQIPLKGTLTIGSADYPIVDIIITGGIEVQFIATGIDAELPSLIGKVITLSGMGQAHFNGDYLVTIDVAGVDTFRADRQDAFSTTYPSSAFSGNAAVPTNVDIPVTGVVNFDSPASAKPGFGTLSVVDKGYVDEQIGANDTLQEITTNGNTTDKDLEVTDTLKGVILKAPDGARWRITIGNDGALITTSL